MGIMVDPPLLVADELDEPLLVKLRPQVVQILLALDAEPYLSRLRVPIVGL